MMQFHLQVYPTTNAILLCYQKYKSIYHLFYVNILESGKLVIRKIADYDKCSVTVHSLYAKDIIKSPYKSWTIGIINLALSL